MYSGDSEVFPYVAWIAGFHFAMEVLSVRSQKEFRFKLRDVQGLGKYYLAKSLIDSLT